MHSPTIKWRKNECGTHCHKIRRGKMSKNSCLLKIQTCVEGNAMTEGSTLPGMEWRESKTIPPLEMVQVFACKQDAAQGNEPAFPLRVCLGNIPFPQMCDVTMMASLCHCWTSRLPSPALHGAHLGGVWLSGSWCSPSPKNAVERPSREHAKTYWPGTFFFALRELSLVIISRTFGALLTTSIKFLSHSMLSKLSLPPHKWPYALCV